MAISVSESRGSPSASMPWRAEHVAERLVEGEMVLYDSAHQRVHILNPTAAFIWQLCDGDHTPAAIVDTLAARYPEHRSAIEADVLGLLEAFRSAGILRP